MELDFVCSLREPLIRIQNGAVEPGCVFVSGSFGNNDQVRVPSSIPSNHVFTLLEGELSITGDIDIDLGGRSISAEHASRVMAIDGLGQTVPIVSLSNLQLNNGSASGAGGGLNIRDSEVTLNRVAINNNLAQFGAGLSIIGGLSDLTMSECSVSNNSASSSGGGMYLSGGDFNSINIELIDCDVSSNIATGHGAGVYANNPVKLRDTRIQNNISIARGGGMVANNGVDMDYSLVKNNIAIEGGGGIFAGSGSITITNTTIAQNRAESGGGIWLNQQNQAIVSSIDSSAIFGNSAEHGGGLYRVGSGQFLDVRNTTIADNMASKGAGAYVNDSSVKFVDATISGNSATERGGGIYASGNNGEQVQIINTIVTNNQGGGAEIYQASDLLSVSHSLIGDDQKTNAQSLVNVSLNQSNISANVDGTNPTAFAAIISPLMYSGGVTRVNALPSGSPAINAADPDRCPPIDQQGVRRDNGSLIFPVTVQTGGAVIINLPGSCDIGAYEKELP